MKFTFFIRTTERRIYLNDTWISNGHWLARKAATQHVPSLKNRFKPWMSAQHGAYEAGVLLLDIKLPEFERVIPRRDGYQPAKLSGQVIYRATVVPEIASVFLEDALGRTASIDSRYVGLLALGTVHINCPNDPVLLMDSADEIVGLIMPLRTGEAND